MESLFASAQIEFVFLGLVFAAVVLVVAGGFLMIFGGERRLPAPVRSAAASLRYAAPNDFIGSWLSRIGSQAAESYEDVQRNQIRMKLIRAGYRNPAAVYAYYAVRHVLAIALPITITAFGYFVTGNIGTHRLMLLGLSSAAFGLYAPAFWLSHCVSNRRTAIQRSFPDALDMLLVCVEAGASFAVALQRVAQEIGRAHPILAEELRLVSAGLNAGQSREEALLQFADRAGSDDVSSFSTIMIQSELFGTSISNTLRVQAAEMRQKRLLRAEEMANKLPVKMTFPMALMIFPVILIVIMTPIMFRILDAFKLMHH
jgi:tight adherence protein C